jgi:hypothetical protein
VFKDALEMDGRTEIVDEEEEEEGGEERVVACEILLSALCCLLVAVCYLLGVVCRFAILAACSFSHGYRVWWCGDSLHEDRRLVPPHIDDRLVWARFSKRQKGGE